MSIIDISKKLEDLVLKNDLTDISSILKTIMLFQKVMNFKCHL
jgi:hypothetical protein